jgi:hypothetical protein
MVKDVLTVVMQLKVVGVCQVLDNVFVPKSVVLDLNDTLVGMELGLPGSIEHQMVILPS